MKEKIHACRSSSPSSRPLAFSSHNLPPNASVPSSSSSSSPLVLSSSEIPFVPVPSSHPPNPHWPHQLLTSPRLPAHICHIFFRSHPDILLLLNHPLPPLPPASRLCFHQNKQCIRAIRGVPLIWPSRESAAVCLSNELGTVAPRLTCP